jgi:hypothetical protein
MKAIKLYVMGVLTAVLLPLTCISSHAQPTNFMAYNFVTCPPQPIWTGGGESVSVQCDPTVDASNNPASGSMRVTVNCNGGEYMLWWDGATPYYSGLPLVGVVAFTNLSWDMRYAPGSATRTNGDGSLDFGFMRVGSRSLTWGQDWYYYWAVPATNGAGQPNTNWIHMNVDLRSVPGTFPELADSGLVDTMFAQDDGALHGQQIIWFDNIEYSGYVAPPTGPAHVNTENHSVSDTVWRQWNQWPVSSGPCG